MLLDFRNFYWHLTILAFSVLFSWNCCQFFEDFKNLRNFLLLHNFRILNWSKMLTQKIFFFCSRWSGTDFACNLNFSHDTFHWGFQSINTIFNTRFQICKFSLFSSVSTVWCNQIGAVFSDMSSRTALTSHLGMKTTF